MRPQVLLDRVPDERLGCQLDCCKLTDSLENSEIIHIVVVLIFDCQLRWVLGGLRRSVSHLLELKVFQELCPCKETERSKLL